MPKSDSNKAGYIKCTVPMPKEMVRFLHNMGLGAKTPRGGYKMAKATIVRAICEALEEVDKKVGIDLRGVTTQGQVKERVLAAIRKYRS